MRRKARGRMLWGSISTSERVNRLSLKAALLYTWLFAHADDQGRMSGNPATIKAVVCPMRDDIPRDEVEGLLSYIEDTGLIFRYTPYGQDAERMKETSLEIILEDSIIQIIDWWEYQALREPKPSRYPPYSGWDKDRIGHQYRDEHGRYDEPE